MCCLSLIMCCCSCQCQHIVCVCLLCVCGHVEPNPIKGRGQDRNRESDLELDARGPRGASRGSYCGSIQPLLVDSGRNGVKGAKTLLMTLLYRIEVKGSTTEPGANSQQKSCSPTAATDRAVRAPCHVDQTSLRSANSSTESIYCHG